MEKYRLYGFADADFTNDASGKSSSEFVIFFNGGPIAWKLLYKRRFQRHQRRANWNHYLIHQQILFIYSTFLKNSKSVFLNQPIFFPIAPQPLVCINPVQHSKLRNVDTKTLKVREFVRSGKILLLHIPDEDQLADILTKSVPKQKFQKCVNEMAAFPLFS